jgi:hypothetical protein
VSGLCGIQLIGLGILGEYVGRIYEASKKRPLFVVRKSIASADEKWRVHRRAS